MFERSKYVFNEQQLFTLPTKLSNNRSKSIPISISGGGGGYSKPQVITPVQPRGINQTTLLTAQSVPSFQGAANAIKTLPNDTIEIGKNSSEKVNKKKKSSIKKKVILGATGLLLVGLSISAVKSRNARLKDFREIFMREDMTKKEAHEIYKRYSDLYKIKDDKEYAKAVFEEAKKNYGLEKSKIRFEIVDVLKEQDKNCIGYFFQLTNSIKLKSGLSRKDIVDTIHHELRHALQYKYALSVNDELAKQSIQMHMIGFHGNKRQTFDEYEKSLLTMDDITRMVFCSIFKKDHISQRIIEKYRSCICGKDFVVPEKYRDFANKCAKGNLNYKSGEGHNLEYFDNFIEKDARNAGFKMKEYLLGWGASFEKAEAKFRAWCEKQDAKANKS